MLRLIGGVFTRFREIQVRGRVITCGSWSRVQWKFNRNGKYISLRFINGLEKKQIDEKIDDILNFELGHHFERPIRTYSSGMKARLGYPSLQLKAYFTYRQSIRELSLRLGERARKSP